MIFLPVCWPEGLLACPPFRPGSCAAETNWCQGAPRGGVAAPGHAPLPQGTTPALHTVCPHVSAPTGSSCPLVHWQTLLPHITLAAYDKACVPEQEVVAKA